jgi:hypothetical protein
MLMRARRRWFDRPGGKAAEPRRSGRTARSRRMGRRPREAVRCCGQGGCRRVPGVDGDEPVGRGPTVLAEKGSLGGLREADSGGEF